MQTKNHIIRDSEDIVENIVDYYGKKRNGLFSLDISDIAPCLLEEYCEARIREDKFDGECVHQADIDETLMGIIGREMDRESCYELIESIKGQMVLYYGSDLEESIEKHLREINFPEDIDTPIVSSIGWSAVYWAENPPEGIQA